MGRLYDPEVETWLLDPREEHQGRLVAEERADQEASDRRAADAKIREIEELPARMRSDSEDGSQPQNIGRISISRACAPAT